MITATDFQVSIVANSSAVEAFDHVCRVTDWWTTDIEGATQEAGSSFTVRFADTYVGFQITEFIPGHTLSWHVKDCYLPWLDNKTEWTGTTVRFDFSPSHEGSQVTLTHVGLQPELECFESCSMGWQHFFGTSLRGLIQDGIGTPKGCQTHLVLPASLTSSEAFESICRVSEWWSTDFEGNARSLGDRFSVRFDDRLNADCRVADISPGKRIVWEVTNSHLDFVDDKSEWTGTQIIWAIREHKDSTQVTMTHMGLNSEKECFTNCVKIWDYFVAQSLAKLITEGKGSPCLPEMTGDTNE